MTVPMEIQHAGEAFDRFMLRAMVLADLTTRHQTYTMAEGVLRTFRRRLTLKDAVRFAGALPPLLRAIYVSDWDVEAPVLPFGDRRDMTREVQDLRRHHNLAPDNAIAAVALALRETLTDVAAFDRALAVLPAEAAAFWAVDPQ